MNEVPFLPAASAEFLVAVRTYASERQLLAADYIAEVERVTRRIRTFPDHGSPYLAGTRRVLCSTVSRSASCTRGHRTIS